MQEEAIRAAWEGFHRDSSWGHTCWRCEPNPRGALGSLPEELGPHLDRSGTPLIFPKEEAASPLLCLRLLGSFLDALCSEIPV